MTVGGRAAGRRPAGTVLRSRGEEGRATAVPQGMTDRDDKIRLPSLQELAGREVSRALQSLRRVPTYELLRVYVIAHQCRVTELEDAALQRIIASVDGLIELAGKEALESALGSQLYAQVMEQRSEAAAAVDALRRASTGVVVDRAVPATDNAATVRDAAGNACYSPQALQVGMVWPPDVDPARREDFLSVADFERCLGMTRAEFKALPAWRQRKVKHGAGLF